MAKTKSKKDEGIELLEDPNAIVGKAEEFFSEKKNRNIVFGVGGAIALAVVLFFGYRYYINDRNNEAQQEMFQAVYYFEADSLGKALNGDGINYGFLDIVEDYSGTDAANLSSFYAGATYLKLGDYDLAIRYLKDFSTSAVVIQARAYSLIGDAYMESGSVDEAISYYEQAVDEGPNKEFTPVYLRKLAIAHEANGNYQQAADAYGTIVKEFFESPEVADAQKHKARLEGLAAQ